MKNCRKCNKEFPLKMIVEGKERSFQHRFYCLTCSPFGARNTSKLERISANTTRPCIVCGLDATTRRRRCNACNTKINRLRAKLKAILYLGGKCQHCGWNKHPAGFQFHHRDPKEKDFNIGAISNRRWEVIQVELDKCELLCACCHAIHHTDKFDNKLLLEVADIKKYW